MKKILIVFSVLIAGLFTFSSCNKNLKDDINELRKQLKDVSHEIGADEPITVTTSFKDRNNVNRSYTGTYKIKLGGIRSQKLAKKPDGTYDIYIHRMMDIDNREHATVSFSYNPITKAITKKQVYHTWNDFSSYNPNAWYNESFHNTGLTINIDIKRLDLTTGAISLDVEASGNEEYSNTAPSYYVPRRGAALSTKLSFEGKLKYYEDAGS